MAIGNEELIHESSSEHLLMEQHEWNKTKKYKKKDCLTVAQNYHPPGVATPRSMQWMNYLKNLTHISNPSTTSNRLLRGSILQGKCFYHTYSKSSSLSHLASSNI